MFNIPESVFNIPGIGVHVPGIRVHVPLESVFKIVRNTHRGRAVDYSSAGLHAHVWEHHKMVTVASDIIVLMRLSDAVRVR